VQSFASSEMKYPFLHPMLCLPAHKQNDSRMGAGTDSSSIDRPLFADASSTKKSHSNYPTCSPVHKCGLIRLTSMQWEMENEIH